MRPGSALERRMAELHDRRVPYVKATVVRAHRPASARPGDTAIVLEDGTIEGFVGGVCAEATVRLQALRVLRRGEALLLRISPDVTVRGDVPDVDGVSALTEPATEAVLEEGALTVANPCLSGGELEIFLEPLPPEPRMLVIGQSPIAQALLAIGSTLEYDVRAIDPEQVDAEALAQASALVVASHGRGEESALTKATRAELPYVALVSSPKRGAAVLAELDLTAEQRDSIRTPAGLWLGARTPGEVAVSILAEFIAVLRGVPVHHGGTPHPAVETVAEPAQPEPRTAIDPVCGMTVAVVADTPHLDLGGREYWFCRNACREAFAADPARFASVS